MSVRLLVDIKMEQCESTLCGLAAQYGSRRKYEPMLKKTGFESPMRMSEPVTGETSRFLRSTYWSDQSPGLASRETNLCVLVCVCVLVKQLGKWDPNPSESVCVRPVDGVIHYPYVQVHGASRVHIQIYIYAGVNIRQFVSDQEFKGSYWSD